MHRLTFILATLCLLGVPIEAKPQSTCIQKAADIVFVLDSSTSIWIRDYRKQLKFVASLVDTFGVGKDNSQVRVGVITFSDQAHLEFSLGTYTDPIELKKTIRKIPQRRGETNTAAALRLLREEVRPNLKNSKGPTVAIVITDGDSMDSEATEKEAEKLHQLGINVHAIGVGNPSMFSELEAIASDPEKGVHTVLSYSELKKIKQTFDVNVCEDKSSKPTRTSIGIPTRPVVFTSRTATVDPVTIPEKSTEIPKTTKSSLSGITTEFATVKEPQNAEPHYPQKKQSNIILFGYDMVSIGGYGSRMIRKFINTILPYTVYGHFGVVTYGQCPSGYNVPITSLMDLDPSQIKNSIVSDGRLPDLVDVVRKIRNTLYVRSKENFERDLTEQQVAVLFVDPSTTAITPELTKEIEMLKKNDVKLYLVSVGPCSWKQLDQLYSLSSKPTNKYMFSAPSYHQLVLDAKKTPQDFNLNSKLPNNFQIS